MGRIIKWIMFFMRNNLVYIIIIILDIISAILWLKGPTLLKEVGLHAFVELLMMLVTLGIVENLIRKKKARDMMPIKAAIYRDIQLFMSRILGFWSSVYFLAVPDEDPTAIDNLFSEDCFSNMLRYLNLDACPNVTPTTDWWNWFQMQGTEIQSRGSKILDRYYSYLEPDVFRHIHLLVEGGFFVSSMQNILNMQNCDIRNGIPRPHYLAAYYPMPDQETFNAIIALYNWCDKSYDELVNDGFTVYRLNMNSNGNKLNLPPSMITEEEFLRQNNLYTNWQAVHTNIHQDRSST